MLHTSLKIFYTFYKRLSMRRSFIIKDIKNVQPKIFYAVVCVSRTNSEFNGKTTSYSQVRLCTFDFYI
jgi:predicted nucleic-acid-binding Zn-ribbon protein